MGHHQSGRGTSETSKLSCAPVKRAYNTMLVTTQAFRAAGTPQRVSGRRAIGPVARPCQLLRISSAPQRQQRLVARSFDGNAAKSLQEAAALDELIDLMLSAKSQQEVRRLGRRWRRRSGWPPLWRCTAALARCIVCPRQRACRACSASVHSSQRLLLHQQTAGLVAPCSACVGTPCCAAPQGQPQRDAPRLPRPASLSGLTLARRARGPPQARPAGGAEYHRYRHQVLDAHRDPQRQRVVASGWVRAGLLAGPGGARGPRPNDD